jgi:two-component system, NtrC family, sensor histidine kinase HydH
MLSLKKAELDSFRGLKWLMFCRVIFTTLLLGSAIILQLRETSFLAFPILLLYGLIIFIFFLSFLYAILIKWLKHYELIAYMQIVMDTFVVTMIVFVTGSFSSIFAFLYLLVIIYAGMLLTKKGNLTIAALCSVQYGIMLTLEYYKVLIPFGIKIDFTPLENDWSYFFYKFLITTTACFAVAFLTSLLSEREQKSKKELRIMRDHVKSVEKLAVIGEMAAGLAHEIKNPLASLSGSIQILREEIQYDPFHDKLMQIVLRETDRLSTLVGDFLMFAKPPAGNALPLELDRAVQETVSLFENAKTCHNRISIVKNYTSGIWIKMDPMHLRQVIWNLLLNAVEAIENQGKIFIRIYFKTENLAAVEISDTGCGMTNDQIKSIFDPFYTTKPNGTGLGLSIVHSILKSYKSRIDVESELNNGSKITLNFRPIKPSEQPKEILMWKKTG